jgi:hypothetical protein
MSKKGIHLSTVNIENFADRLRKIISDQTQSAIDLEKKWPYKAS